MLYLNPERASRLANSCGVIFASKLLGVFDSVSYSLPGCAQHAQAPFGDVVLVYP